MKTRVVIRIASLGLALVGVFVLMRMITPERMQAFFGAVGDEAGKASFRLCVTRIHAFVFPDGRKIEEFKSGMQMKWVAYDPEPRELNYLEIEKWLGKYCMVQAQPGKDVVIEYIDQTKREVGAQGDLIEAFAELRQLAQFE